MEELHEGPVFHMGTKGEKRMKKLVRGAFVFVRSKQ
jgi:hypothetical protein